MPCYTGLDNCKNVLAWSDPNAPQFALLPGGTNTKSIGYGDLVLVDKES